MEDVIKEMYGDLLLQVTKLKSQLRVHEAQLKLFEDLKNKSKDEVHNFVKNYTRDR